MDVAKQQNQLVELVNQSAQEIAKALPNYCNSERFIRIVLTELRTNRKLQQCTPASFMGAVMQSAQWGLEFGVAGHAWMIPYKNECTFQVGFQGYLHLMKKNGSVTSCTIGKICENDEYEFEYGTYKKFIHKFGLGERGKTLAYYCYTKLFNGDEDFTIMNVSEIAEHERKFVKYNSEMWKKHHDAMCKKTVIKAHAKYMALSPEITALTASDEVIMKSENEREYFEPEPELKPVENKIKIVEYTGKDELPEGEGVPIK